MRVGLVCPYDLSKPGGVQAQVRDLARHLEAGGDQVAVIGPGLPEGSKGVDLGGTITVPANRSMVPLSVDPRVVRAINDAVADLELLHVHEPLMPVVSLSSLRAGIPVVGTFHAAPGAFGIGFYTVIKSQLKRLLGPNLKKITAVSETAAAPLPDDLEVVIVPNGIDLESFDLDTHRHPTRVAFLGRDEKRKGLDVLLAAWGRVVEATPNAELVVMGADRGIEGITWMGTVDDPTKREVLNSAAIYVAPNLGGESFGIVLIEGMAAGAATVASDLASFRDVGSDVVRYFATGDSHDLAATLIDLLDDPATVETMSAAGRQRARRFDWETVASSYHDIYEQVLSEST